MNASTLVSVLPVLLAPLILGLLGWLYVRAGEPVPEEEGRSPLHQRRVSGRVGALTYRGPFIRVAVYNDFVVIRSGLAAHVVPFRGLALESRRLGGLSLESPHLSVPIVIGVSDSSQTAMALHAALERERLALPQPDPLAPGR